MIQLFGHHPHFSLHALQLSQDSTSKRCRFTSVKTVKGPLFLVPEQGGSVPIIYNFVWSLCVYVVLRCCQLGCVMLPATCYPNRTNLYKSFEISNEPGNSSTSTVRSHSFPWKTGTLCPGPISSGVCQRCTRLSSTSRPSGCAILIATATP